MRGSNGAIGVARARAVPAADLQSKGKPAQCVRCGAVRRSAPRGGGGEGALAAVRAQRRCWVVLGPLPVTNATLKRPSEKNKNDPDALWNYWRSRKKQPSEDTWCALQLRFSGVLWASLVGAFGDGAPAFDYG